MNELINTKPRGALQDDRCTRGPTPRERDWPSLARDVTADRGFRLQSAARNRRALHRISWSAVSPEPANGRERGDLYVLQMRYWRAHTRKPCCWRESLCEHSHWSQARWRYALEDRPSDETCRGSNDAPPTWVQNLLRRRTLDRFLSPRQYWCGRAGTWSIQRGYGGPPRDNPTITLRRGCGLSIYRSSWAQTSGRTELNEWLARIRDVYLRMLLSRDPEGRVPMIWEASELDWASSPPGDLQRGPGTLSRRLLRRLAEKPWRILGVLKCGGEAQSKDGDAQVRRHSCSTSSGRHRLPPEVVRRFQVQGWRRGVCVCTLPYSEEEFIEAERRVFSSSRCKRMEESMSRNGV